MCRSPYSLMSMRTIAGSLSNRNSASVCASSVLPTPVGPRKRNEPIGRFGSPSPARERRTASATAMMASSWSTTRSWRWSSSLTSFSHSPSSIRVTGMPVHGPTTSAMSSDVDLLLEHPVLALDLLQGAGLGVALALERRDGAEAQLGGPVAGRRRASPGRATRAPPRLSFDRRPMAAMRDFSISQRAESTVDLLAQVGELLLDALAPLGRGRVGLLGQGGLLDLELLRAGARGRRSRSGSESSSMRRRLAASSTRSMALSGRKRSVM